MFATFDISVPNHKNRSLPDHLTKLHEGVTDPSTAALQNNEVGEDLVVEELMGEEK